MRISDLSKELGVGSKEVMEFLKAKGLDYSSHFNSVNPDEERMIRDKFGSGQITGQDDDSKKSVTTIRRSGIRRERSFIPHSERDVAEEGDPFKSLDGKEKTAGDSEEKQPESSEGSVAKGDDKKLADSEIGRASCWVRV